MIPNDTPYTVYKMLLYFVSFFIEPQKQSAQHNFQRINSLLCIFCSAPFQFSQECFFCAAAVVFAAVICGLFRHNSFVVNNNKSIYKNIYLYYLRTQIYIYILNDWGQFGVVFILSNHYGLNSLYIHCIWYGWLCLFYALVSIKFYRCVFSDSYLVGWLWSYDF